MTEEIKEILNTFKELTEDYSASSLLDFEEYEIPCMQLKMVLDYITSLQEENKKLKQRNKLKKYDLKLEKNIISDYKQKKDKYKSRIDKIIAHLGNCDWNNKDFEKIYDIAIGNDEE